MVMLTQFAVIRLEYSFGMDEGIYLSDSIRRVTESHSVAMHLVHQQVLHHSKAK